MDLIHDHEIWGNEKIIGTVPHIIVLVMVKKTIKLMKLLMAFGISKLYTNVQRLQMENDL